MTDATPAALGLTCEIADAKAPRICWRAQMKGNIEGGLGSIAEQLVDHKIEVILGGGKARFDQIIDAGPFKGQTVLQSAVAQGYRFVSDAEALTALSPGGRVLGLFNAGDMTQEWIGQRASPNLEPPQHCKEGNRPSTEPSLSQMAQKAIELLGAREPGNVSARDPQKGIFPASRGRVHR